jgi:hypothetical protein
MPERLRQKLVDFRAVTFCALPKDSYTSSIANPNQAYALPFGDKAVTLGTCTRTGSRGRHVVPRISLGGLSHILKSGLRAGTYNPHQLPQPFRECPSRTASATHIALIRVIRNLTKANDFIDEILLFHYIGTLLVTSPMARRHYHERSQCCRYG